MRKGFELIWKSEQESKMSEIEQGYLRILPVTEFKIPLWLDIQNTYSWFHKNFSAKFVIWYNITLWFPAMTSSLQSYNTLMTLWNRPLYPHKPMKIFLCVFSVVVLASTQYHCFSVKVHTKRNQWPNSCYKTTILNSVGMAILKLNSLWQCLYIYILVVYCSY